jgi:hypothetical protein
MEWDGFMVMRSPSDDSVAWQLLESQHGVATVRQLLEAGLSRKRIESLVDRRFLKSECYGIVSVSGAPRTDRFHLMFGVLLGAKRDTSGFSSCAIWGPSAAIEHDLIEPRESDIHVISMRRLASKEGFVFRHTSRLEPSEIVKIDNIPFTDPIRTLIDMADLKPFGALSMYRRGLRKKVFTDAEVGERIWQESRQGRSGLVAVRRARAETDPSAAKAKSWLEDSFFDRIVGLGYPPPLRNAKVRGSFGFDWEIDLFYPPGKGIEVSPSATHGVDNHVKDRRKELDLKIKGIELVTVTEETTDRELQQALLALLGPPKELSDA